ncbi:MAG: DUF3179 domain-containing protein [Candidatus Thorarchaeota archaeon]|jgi:hypothetical protein
MNTRWLVSGFVVVLVVIGVGGGLLLTSNSIIPPGSTPTVPTGPNPPIDRDFEYPVNETLLDELAANRLSGGPPPDGIPSIDDPVYVDVSVGDEFLVDSDIVFGLVYNGEVIAFPQKILVWHEIVNDLVGGEQLSITYCPLTGSSIAFKGNIEGNETTFGTSGSLINSNLVMYDRITSSYWPQIFSQSVSGQEKGVRLERIHMIWTTWTRWKAAFPDTLVLSTTTGYVRDYERDPYGSYNDTNSYYQQGNPVFPVMHEDNRLNPKDVVIGVDVYDAQYAISKEYMRDNKVANLELGDEKVVLFYDFTLDTVRAFSRSLEGQNYTFSHSGGEFIDEETSTTWSREGTSNLGSLIEIDSFDVMWFAWAAFYPQTGLLCSNCA